MASSFPSSQTPWFLPKVWPRCHATLAAAAGHHLLHAIQNAVHHTAPPAQHKETQENTSRTCLDTPRCKGLYDNMCHVSSFQSRSSWISSSVISFASSENSMNASRNSAICSSVLGQANISKSHQALNPFATLLWSMSRPQTLLNTLSLVQLICHAPITKASSNYTGMSM